ncbi:MAG: hypothetical protein AAF958_10145 [Planctomycetota bacterium]
MSRQTSNRRHSNRGTTGRRVSTSRKSGRASMKQRRERNRQRRNVLLIVVLSIGLVIAILTMPKTESDHGSVAGTTNTQGHVSLAANPGTASKSSALTDGDSGANERNDIAADSPVDESAIELNYRTRDELTAVAPLRDTLSIAGVDTRDDVPPVEAIYSSSTRRTALWNGKMIQNGAHQELPGVQLRVGGDSVRLSNQPVSRQPVAAE